MMQKGGHDIERLTGGEHPVHALSYSNHKQEAPTISTRISFFALNVQ